MSRYAQLADSTGKRPSARRVLLLCLGLGLGWLWTAIPVAAQGEVPSPAAEMTGPYRNLAENHAGVFHLKREGDAVYATFRTDRSPVQHFARQQPKVLFTVPEGFRPPVAVTWEVSAQPVQADGTPHPDQPDRRVFRMHVDPEGQVRYVDDSGVDGVGYLRYQTALAWPLAGSDPQICKRHRKIREGILAALQVLEDATLPCSQVDWSHLARIQTLSLSLPVPLDAGDERHALLGLTNLAALQLESWVTRRPVAEDTHLTRLLAHTPRLQTLEIKGVGLSVSTNLLRYTPHLEALHLELRHPAAELDQLLVHVPHLTHLTVAPTTPLPESFLTAVPQLTHLTVRDGLAPCASPNLLAAVPRLTRFAVRMDADAEALACLGSALHRLASDLTELEVELLSLQDLNVELLPNLPQLTQLTLDVTGMAALPEHLLDQAPALTHLALQGVNNSNLPAVTLPAGFLAHTPHLTDLTLKVHRLANLPPALLMPVPNLQQLQIDIGSSIVLPAGFLDPVPQLAELRMKAGSGANLPTDFLIHTPHLEVLHLNAQTQRSLPANFLAYAPRLVDLYLRMPLLPTLPPTFLVHAPRLETLELEAGHGILGNYAKCNQNPPGPRQFPEHFLSHAPRLVELHLRVPMLQSLPPTFLGHAPLLETMEVEYASSGYCFGYGHKDLLKVVIPLRSLPANFLTHTPNLRHLNLQTGYVTEFPPDFLSHAPLLRHLSLDANGISALPADFLTWHPRLETVRLLANGIPSLPTAPRVSVPIPQPGFANAGPAAGGSIARTLSRKHPSPPRGGARRASGQDAPSRLSGARAPSEILESARTQPDSLASGLPGPCAPDPGPWIGHAPTRTDTDTGPPPVANPSEHQLSREGVPSRSFLLHGSRNLMGVRGERSARKHSGG